MHRRCLLQTFVVALTGAAIPSVLGQDRRDEHRDEHREDEHRDDQHRPEYHFRQEDAQRLRQSYREMNKVDREHREHFVAGGRLPNDWRRHIRPVPVVVLHELPPIPAGYVAGYYDGYAVVYDPRSGYILEVLDLM